MAIPAEHYDHVRADLIAGLRRYYAGRQVDTPAQIMSGSRAG